MKFTQYLDAVRYCRYNKLSVDTIVRHGALWKCYWTVTKTKKKKGPNANLVPNPST